MTRFTRRIALLLGLFLVLGAVMGALSLARFSDDPFGLVFARRERAEIVLPDNAGRLVLEHRALALPGLRIPRRRVLILEHAGQPVLETRIFPSRAADDVIRVFWTEPTPSGRGPLVRLREPAGEILVDVVTPLVVRVVPTLAGPILTSPAGDARAGAVIGPDGTVALTDGLSGAGLPEDPGLLLGVVVQDAQAPRFMPVVE